MSNVIYVELSTEDRGTVYFKEDGGRFLEAQTLKICVESAYSIRLTW